MCDCQTPGSKRSKPVQLGGPSGSQPQQVKVLIGVAGVQSGTDAWVTGTDVQRYVDQRFLARL